MSNVIDIFTLHFGMVFHICKYETKIFDQITRDEMEISNLKEFFITFFHGKNVSSLYLHHYMPASVACAIGPSVNWLLN